MAVSNGLMYVFKQDWQSWRAWTLIHVRLVMKGWSIWLVDAW